MIPVLLLTLICGANEMEPLDREKLIERFAFVELNNFGNPPHAKQWIFWETEKQKDGSSEWHVAAWRWCKPDEQQWFIEEFGIVHLEWWDDNGIYRMIEAPLIETFSPTDREVEQRTRRSEQRRTGLKREKFIPILPTE